MQVGKQYFFTKGQGPSQAFAGRVYFRRHFGVHFFDHFNVEGHNLYFRCLFWMNGRVFQVTNLQENRWWGKNSFKLLLVNFVNILFGNLPDNKKCDNAKIERIYRI